MSSTLLRNIGINEFQKRFLDPFKIKITDFIQKEDYFQSALIEINNDDVNTTLIINHSELSPFVIPSGRRNAAPTISIVRNRRGRVSRPGLREAKRLPYILNCKIRRRHGMQTTPYRPLKENPFFAPTACK